MEEQPKGGGGEKVEQGWRRMVQARLGSRKRRPVEGAVVERRSRGGREEVERRSSRGREREGGAAVEETSSEVETEDKVDQVEEWSSNQRSELERRRSSRGREKEGGARVERRSSNGRGNVEVGWLMS